MKLCLKWKTAVLLHRKHTTGDSHWHCNTATYIYFKTIRTVQPVHSILKKQENTYTSTIDHKSTIDNKTFIHGEANQLLAHVSGASGFF